MATVSGMTPEAIHEITDQSLVDAVFDPSTGVATATKRNGEVISIGEAPTLDTIMDAVYPVGSIFMSVSPANPAATLGIGTWTAWGSGRVPVGVDAAQSEFNGEEETGGSKTHTLLAAEMPKHKHTTSTHSHAIDHDHAAFDLPAGGAHSHTYARRAAAGTSGGAVMGNAAALADGTTDSSTHSHNVDVPAFTGSSGSGGGADTGFAGGDGAGATTPFSVLQPYITCHMWKRVS